MTCFSPVPYPVECQEFWKEQGHFTNCFLSIFHTTFGLLIQSSLQVPELPPCFPIDVMPRLPMHHVSTICWRLTCDWSSHVFKAQEATQPRLFRRIFPSLLRRLHRCEAQAIRIFSYSFKQSNHSKQLYSAGKSRIILYEFPCLACV